MTSGFFIKDAFINWEDNPVITTMDSIAAPIKDIQRPTVTVCPDENTPPDNWAPIEVVANYLSFACTNRKYQAYISGYEQLPLCNSTLNIRQDFQYLIESITKDLKEWMTDSALRESHESYGSTDVHDTIEKVASAVLAGDVQKEMIDKLPSDYLGTDDERLTILKSLINETDDAILFYNYYYNNFGREEVNCSSDDCLATMKQLYGILEAMYEGNPSPNLPFGSFLALFLPQKYEEFSNDLKIFETEGLDVDSYFAPKKQAYLNAHDFFAGLAKYYGFQHNESISLFDIPAIMAQNKDLNRIQVAASHSYVFFMTQNNITLQELSRCYNVWNTFSIEQKGQRHPCEEDCCNKGPRSMGNNLEAIMRVMRFAKGRGKARFNSTEFLQHFVDANELRYPIRIMKEDLKDHMSVRDTNAFIPFCELKDAKEKKNDDIAITNEPECQLFNPVITDVGICHSFNAMKTSEMLQPSYFKQSFDNAYKSDFTDNSTIWNGSGSGEDYSLNFYLFDNSAIRHMSKSRPKSFRMSLSTKADYFDFSSTNQIIKPGYHTIWKIQAMEIAPSNDLHELPVEKRNCMFPEEASELKIFKMYSKKACLFECHIKKASEVCKCYPWYIPTLPSKDRHELCDHFGNHCFKSMIKQTRLSNNCSEVCLPTCHHIEFSLISSEKTPLDRNEACEGMKWQWGRLESSTMSKRVRYFIDLIKKNGYNSLAYNYLKAKEWIDDRLGRKPNKTFERWTLGTNDHYNIDDELCQKITNHMAVVSVVFNQDTYVRTKTSLRVSFSDKLAAFGKSISSRRMITYLLQNISFLVGGTLGLFNGMSILSMIEAAYWFLRLLWQFLKPIQKNSLKRI